MSVFRVVASPIVSWLALVAMAGACLIAMAGAVETVRLGGAAAALAALYGVPGVLVPLAPLLVAVAVGLAAARMDARGERLALEAAGVSPSRTVMTVSAIAFSFGLAAWVAHQHVVA